MYIYIKHKNGASFTFDISLHLATGKVLSLFLPSSEIIRFPLSDILSYEIVNPSL